MTKNKKIAIVNDDNLNPAIASALSRGHTDSKLRVYQDFEGSRDLGQKHAFEAHAAPIFDWTGDIPVEDSARQQIAQVSYLPFVKKVAVMPDCHFGMGATIGTIIETEGALIPAAVGVDIGCGITAFPMMGVTRDYIVGKEEAIRQYIQMHIPNGRTDEGGGKDVGKWGTTYDMPDIVIDSLDGKVLSSSRSFNGLHGAYNDLINSFVDAGVSEKAVRHPHIRNHLGTLGTGNHFIEIVADQFDDLWVLVHSGSRGPGAKLANWAMKKAKEIAKAYHLNLPNPDLAYLVEGTPEFDLYRKSVEWATEYAKQNRWIMTMLTVDAVEKFTGLSVPRDPANWTNTSHNWIEKTRNGYLTRKGASKAVRGEYSVMPGSMGARSYLVEGKSNPSSLFSCSHGAGRAMSRTQALKTFTLDDHIKATEGVFCRKDEGVLDETRDAYKDIDQVLAQQSELVDVVHTFSAIINVKG